MEEFVKFKSIKQGTTSKAISGSCSFEQALVSTWMWIVIEHGAKTWVNIWKAFQDLEELKTNP